MKRYRFIGMFIVFGIIFIATVVYLISKAASPAVEYPLEAVQRRDIREIIIATGSIVPKKEIEVKSSLSGVVDEIYIETGDVLEKGSPLLSIKVIPNILDVNSTEAALAKARLRLDTARDEMERQKKQYESKIIPEVTYLETVNRYEMAIVDFKEIQNKMTLIQEGISSGDTSESGVISNIVYAPITGTVLDVPVKEGTPIQENSGMSSGTTVSILADMNTLFFSGEIDETEVGELAIGMPVNITVAALDSTPVNGKLTFISPRGTPKNGSVMFPIEIGLETDEETVLRAGYSASAEIILNAEEDVLSLPERDVIYENGKTFVEVRQDSQEFQKIEIETGISDGVYTQITKGLKEGDAVKARS